MSIAAEQKKTEPYAFNQHPFFYFNTGKRDFPSSFVSESR
jgi:hypothetical protein